ncbi:MAG: Glu/Leu/Phe/Val dehydrogenase dimerization domain-containing protein [Francisellaceae bacterium]
MNLTQFQNKVVDRLKEFSGEEPEIVFHWKDKESTARGILVINSLRGGAAGGGTRVHEHITLDEVTTLAKIMEIKFALSGPAIGGAKTGIKLDPNHPQKYEILSRWYKAIAPILREYYGTGSDLNTDIHKINALLRAEGINNSQAGIIHAISGGNKGKTQNAYHNMILLNADVTLGNIKSKLAELVTGFGVAESVIGYYTALGQKINGKRIYIQGAGNVGAAAAYYLNAAGAKIVAMTDRDAGVINTKGFSGDEIAELITHRRVLNILPHNMTHEEFNKALMDEKIDVFIPAAGSNIVGKTFVDGLIKNGLEVLCCGANHPLVESEYCYGLSSQYLDSKIALLPDFLANMGMARTFYKLMVAEVGDIDADSVFNDIKKTIHQAVEKACKRYDGSLLTACLYDMALNNIEASKQEVPVISI